MEEIKSQEERQENNKRENNKLQTKGSSCMDNSHLEYIPQTGQ
jgi:hypothetical protein